MPTYDYQCLDCDYCFEKISPMAEHANPKCCPKCGAYNSKQIITRGNSFLDPYRMGRVKPSDSFRDTLRDIKNEHPGSTINVD